MNDGGPAFPGIQEYRVSNPSSSQVIIEKALMPGMTLRDYFAAKAIRIVSIHQVVFSAELVAKNAYEIADAMIAERSKSEG